MQKMIADRAFTYAGVPLKAGDTFDCEPHNVSGLVAIGYAHIKKRGNTYQTRAMTAGATMTSVASAAKSLAA